MKNRIHEKLLKHHDELLQWYQSKHTNSYLPFYASFDLRDAGFKIANVDGNIFPAGFNNICQMDKDYAPDLMKEFIDREFEGTKTILLLTEDHMKNSYYWENVLTIQALLDEAGYSVTLGMLSDEIEDGTKIESFSGKIAEVNKAFSTQGQLQTSVGVPDLVICNNDFSNPYEEVDFSNTKMTPLRELGWYRRKKHCYFKYYNELVTEFADIIKEDPWLFHVQTEKFEKFDVTSEESRGQLSDRVDEVLAEIKQKYQEHNIDEQPYVFIKNNSGTYGLGVVEASQGSDIEEWNYKARKKMKAAKGGGGVTEVIIQEGVPSVLAEEGATAEPVIYMVGEELVGGFLRTHGKKDSHQSLNSPGAVYKRLCLSDLKVKAEGALLENVYGWVAKLGLLAISKEADRIKT